jgi:hypothetical protein
MTPLPLPCDFAQASKKLALRILVENKRSREIAERKANATASGQPAVDFHQRKQGHGAATTGKVKVKRFVAVGSHQHTRPRGAMEE